MNVSAIGMRRQRRANSADRLTVEVEIDPRGEGHDRQRIFRRRHGRRATRSGRRLTGKALADIVAGEDGRARFAEHVVAAGMIEVPVRVDQVFRLALRELLDLGEIRLGIGDVLIVDQEDAIIADAEPEIATLAHQHLHARP